METTRGAPWSLLHSYIPASVSRTSESLSDAFPFFSSSRKRPVRKRKTGFFSSKVSQPARYRKQTLGVRPRLDHSTDGTSWRRLTLIRHGRMTASPTHVRMATGPSPEASPRDSNMFHCQQILQEQVVCVRVRVRVSKAQ
ncbi:hypothetical protein EYF80_066408 [Liparis tanakae]|uniref:Uncharacterized protein n=1 Tax=Liparis tanakae TaxID=230148 RepID=A0A4Z2E550_9TELE|nr:hypothetical protein EYF80_066408 [Liparis tanakae]